MKFAGELLIFILIFIVNTRVFFVKEVRRESIVAVVPLCFLLSILLIFSWGIDIFSLYAFFLSFVVLLSNFHALLRYSSHLYIDHYSPLMKTWAVIDTFLTVIVIIPLVFFMSVDFRSGKLNITETQTRVKGSFRVGFEEASPFSLSTGTFYEYSPSELDSKDVTVIFISDKRGDNYHYKPYLQKLASRGYKVVTADFYANDCKWLHSSFDFRITRRFAMVIQSLINNQHFMSQREFYAYNSTLECKAIMDKLKNNDSYTGKYFLVSDVMANSSVSDLKKGNPEKIAGFFCLDTVGVYDTPGYGCVAYTDPLLNYILGNTREYRAEMIEEMVQKTVDEITLATSVPSDVF